MGIDSLVMLVVPKILYLWRVLQGGSSKTLSCDIYSQVQVWSYCVCIVFCQCSNHMYLCLLLWSCKINWQDLFSKFCDIFGFNLWHHWSSVERDTCTCLFIQDKMSLNGWCFYKQFSDWKAKFYFVAGGVFLI